MKLEGTRNLHQAFSMPFFLPFFEKRKVWEEEKSAARFTITFLSLSPAFEKELFMKERGREKREIWMNEDEYIHPCELYIWKGSRAVVWSSLFYAPFSVQVYWLWILSIKRDTKEGRERKVDWTSKRVSVLQNRGRWENFSLKREGENFSFKRERKEERKMSGREGGEEDAGWCLCAKGAAVLQLEKAFRIWDSGKRREKRHSMESGGRKEFCPLSLSLSILPWKLRDSDRTEREREREKTQEGENSPPWVVEQESVRVDTPSTQLD